MYCDITGVPPTPAQQAKALAMVPFTLTPSYEYAIEQMIRNEYMARQNFIRFCGDENAKEKPLQLSILKTKTVMVMGLVKNIETSLDHVKKYINDLRTYFDRVVFYFYHNNSTDNSEYLLKQWMNHDEDVKGTFDENIEICVLNEDGGIGNRIPVMAKMRNNNVKDAFTSFGTDFDYFIITNTDFVEDIDISGVIKSFNLVEPWSVICGNCCFTKSYYHYDAFALRFMEDEKNIEVLYPRFNIHYGKNGHWLNKIHIFEGWTKVYSGCGDMMIIEGQKFVQLWNGNNKNYICEVNESDPTKCELISLCEKIEGDVWVSPYIMHPSSMSLEGNLYLKPMQFVPRDAGFFSVFNFLMGSIVKGGRVYPYYNKTTFERINGENRHFCYWSESKENGWFEYFEPVQFYHGDEEHISNSFVTYSITQGEYADVEFRVSSSVQRLMCDKDRYGSWRMYVNKFFQKYIKIKQEITDDVNKFWMNTFQRFGSVVGVHYRHPSHYVEGGEIYLRDYFVVVDQLLEKHPYAKIFIASDNEFGIVAFEKRYGSKCVFYLPDIDRVDLDNILEWAHAKSKKDAHIDNMDFINGVGYQLHYTKCQNNEMSSKAGKDILKEALCLSKCKWLVHITSNVSLAVSYINPNIDMYTITEK